MNEGTYVFEPPLSHRVLSVAVPSHRLAGVLSAVLPLGLERCPSWALSQASGAERSRTRESECGCGCGNGSARGGLHAAREERCQWTLDNHLESVLLGEFGFWDEMDRGLVMDDVSGLGEVRHFAEVMSVLVHRLLDWVYTLGGVFVSFLCEIRLRY